MINNETNNSITPLHTTINNPPTYSNKDKSLNNIASVQNQHVEFINIPIELKQKIAFNLDGISYSNLRLTSKDMSDAIPSYKKILSQLKNKCSGETKKTYINFYKNSIVQLIKNENKDDVIQCLKSTSVDRRYINSTCITINTKYRPGANVSQPHWNGNILARCNDEIIKLSNNKLKPNLIIGQLQTPFSPVENRFVMLDIQDENLNKNNINIIFYAFNVVFNKERSSDRFLVALSALQLKNYLYNHPPKGMNKNEISDNESRYPFLFMMGMIVDSCVSRNIFKK